MAGIKFHTWLWYMTTGTPRTCPASSCTKPPKNSAKPHVMSLVAGSVHEVAEPCAEQTLRITHARLIYYNC